jgi:RNA polymerase sigma-70 factor, ECF subfamily
MSTSRLSENAGESLNSDQPKAALDDEVLALASATDRAAFAELYRRHVNRVYRYLAARTGNVRDAEELTSQTFLAALESLPRYQNQGKFAVWLCSIARRKAVDYFRAKRDTFSIDILPELSDSAALPEDIVIENIARDQIRTAINALIPERAEALTLRLIVGLSAAEAGLVMGKSEAAIGMLVHRAIRDLRVRLTHAAEVVK